ncbi:hypothetical protein OPIT5_16180 [Opitutaceae bacterium TAV5]|nr:hypothetical protein OPIT5_16180 [Opitutaceae bacterium TAV5]
MGILLPMTTTRIIADIIIIARQPGQDDAA